MVSQPLSSQNIEFNLGKNDKDFLNTIPRITWKFALNIAFIDSTKLTDDSIPKNPFFAFGGTIQNFGIIYKTLNGDKYKHESKSIGLTLSLNKIGVFQDEDYISLFLGLNYNFHYREKIFIDNLRKNKKLLYSEWTSERVNMFTPYLKIKYCHSTKLEFFTEVYFDNFMNNNFIEPNSSGFKPYEHLYFNKLTVGINVFGFIKEMIGIGLFSAWLNAQ